MRTNAVVRSWRWQYYWWGGHVMGACLFAACSDGPWWHVAAWSFAYLTGFWAAVLVEIATQ